MKLSTESLKARVRSHGINPEIEISPEELEELKTKYGYEPVLKLGEGHTREVFFSLYKRGEDVERSRVLKRAIQSVDPNSIQAMIAAEKGGWDHKEVEISNDLNHPNITKVVDSFEINGRRYNVEEFEDGEDLETRVLSGWRYDNRQIGKLFSGILEGALYLHDRGVLHRDLKPSNILIVSNDHPKISDLQTAAYMHDVKKSFFPTRGAIAYCHPRLINVLLSGIPDCANQKTEVHSLGGVLYFTLTGEKPFNYNVIIAETGKPLIVGDRTFKIKLYNGEEEIPEITDEIHEKELKRRLAKVPRKWRGLVYRCLTTTEKGFRDISELKRYFDSVNAGFISRIKDGLVIGARYILPSLAAGGLIGIITAAAIMRSGEEHRPTMAEIYGAREYAEFSLENIPATDKPYINYLLVPYLEDARRRLPEIEENVDINRYAERTGRSHGIPKRLFNSWLRACYLHQDKLKTYAGRGQFRIGPSFVPHDFVIRSSRGGAISTDLSTIVLGASYLKQCITPGCRAPDVYSMYFATIEEINTARVRTEDIQYLPGHRDRTTIGKGYQSFLPNHVRDLVNTATALFLITDEEGQIHWEKAPVKSYDDIKRGYLILDY